MIDIIGVSGTDIDLYDTQTTRAANILGTQLGALEYAQDMGVDLRYFLQDGIKFQNESFRAYCVEILASSGINVSSVDTILETLYAIYNFNLAPEEVSTGMLAR